MRKFISFVFFLSFLFAEDEIQVALTTASPLSPVYLSTVIMEKDGDGESYFNRLRQVLAFDLDNSGYIVLLEKEKSKETILSNNDLKVAFDPLFWKEQKTRFVIKFFGENKQLNVFIYDTLKNQSKLFATINLSADIDKDRKKIHKISDDILLEYLGKKGIAQYVILYTVRRDNPDRKGMKWLSEVFACDFDGENSRQLTFENNYCVTPVPLPSAYKGSIPGFLYVSYKKGIPKIYMNLENEGRAFVQLRGNQLLPSISLNFDQLAFISDAAGRPDLFLQRLDRRRIPLGKPIQLFSAPRATQASPAFSPDGKKLAFVSDKDGTPRIYIMKVPEIGEDNVLPSAHLLTKKNKNNVTPAWSNDGTKLVYSANTSGPREIWIYDFNTDEERQLTFGKENKENPCWADDNLHIVYNTEDKDISELYIINLNNPKPVKISTGLGQKRFPVWGR